MGRVHTLASIIYYRCMLRCVITALIITLAFTPALAHANAAAYSFSYSLPQKLNNYFLKASYTFTNKVTNVSTVIAKQLSKPQVARLLAYVISRRFVAFAALGMIASQAGMTTLDVDGESVLVQKLPATSQIDVLQAGQNDFVPIIGGVLSSSYCSAALAQLNYEYSHLGVLIPAPSKGSAWCEVVTFSSTYKELSLTVGTQADPESTRVFVVQPRAVSTDVIEQPVPGYAVVPNTVLVDTVFNKATPADLAPLFDYNETYQSPAAIDAINEYNSTKNESFPLTYPDVTTPNLDKPVTTAPATSLEFPSFCEWAEVVCSAIDWVKSGDEIPEEEEHEIGQLTESDMPTGPTITFAAACPNAVSIPYDLGILSSSISIDFMPVCNFLNDIRPFVIAAAYLHAAYIIGGTRRSD